jgi:hypothetical protein
MVRKIKRNGGKIQTIRSKFVHALSRGHRKTVHKGKVVASGSLKVVLFPVSSEATRGGVGRGGGASPQHTVLTATHCYHIKIRNLILPHLLP